MAIRADLKARLDVAGYDERISKRGRSNVSLNPAMNYQNLSGASDGVNKYDRVIKSASKPQVQLDESLLPPERDDDSFEYPSLL